VKRETLIAGAVFAALPVVVLTLALIATYAVAHGAPAYVRLPFRFICHGIPRRCLTIWNTPMPICARCTAIYAGLLTGLLLFPLMPWMRERVARITLLVALVPMGIDGTTQAMLLRESTNPLRIITGSIAGLAFGYWVLCAMERRDEQVFTSP